jgi:hypothetical protein
MRRGSRQLVGSIGAHVDGLAWGEIIYVDDMYDVQRQAWCNGTNSPHQSTLRAYSRHDLASVTVQLQPNNNSKLAPATYNDLTN